MFKVSHTALGVGDPAIVPDSAFHSSSERISLNYSAYKALKGVEGEWCAHYSNQHQWLEANVSYEQPSFGNVKIRALKLNNETSGVITYLLNASTDGKKWTSVDNNQV